jgi:hypothetical protein
MLHDIDATTSGRTNPTVSSDDKVVSPMAHQTVSTQYNPIGDAVNARLQQVGKTIIANDGTTNKAMFGYNPGMDLWGTFVAKDGINVMTNTDPNNLIFNSSQNIFKIVAVGSVVMPTYSVTSGVGWRISSVATPPSATVAHGQARVPLVIAYMRVTGPGGKTLLSIPYTSTSLVGGNLLMQTISISVDATYISFNDTTTTDGSVGVYTAGGETIDYYIYQETAQ